MRVCTARFSCSVSHHHPEHHLQHVWHRVGACSPSVLCGRLRPFRPVLPARCLSVRSRGGGLAAGRLRLAACCGSESSHLGGLARARSPRGGRAMARPLMYVIVNSRSSTCRLAAAAAGLLGHAPPYAPYTGVWPGRAARRRRRGECPRATAARLSQALPCLGPGLCCETAAVDACQPKVLTRHSRAHSSLSELASRACTHGSCSVPKRRECDASPRDRQRNRRRRMVA